MIYEKNPPVRSELTKEEAYKQMVKFAHALGEMPETVEQNFRYVTEGTIGTPVYLKDIDVTFKETYGIGVHEPAKQRTKAIGHGKYHFFKVDAGTQFKTTEKAIGLIFESNPDKIHWFPKSRTDFVIEKKNSIGGTKQSFVRYAAIPTWLWDKRSDEDHTSHMELIDHLDPVDESKLMIWDDFFDIMNQESEQEKEVVAHIEKEKESEGFKLELSNIDEDEIAFILEERDGWNPDFDLS